jgi:hypothetical protein
VEPLCRPAQKEGLGAVFFFTRHSLWFSGANLVGLTRIALPGSFAVASIARG